MNKDKWFYWFKVEDEKLIKCEGFNSRIEAEKELSKIISEFNKKNKNKKYTFDIEKAK